MANEVVDVVIVGGGLAGLSAALRLKDFGGGMTYVVLEGDPERLGGRTRGTAKDFDLDFGGGYVGESQNYIQYLARRFQINLIKEYLPTDKVWLFEDRDGNMTALPGDAPSAVPGGLNAALGLEKLDTLTIEVRDHLDRLSQSASAALDQTTVQDFIDGEVAAFAKQPDGSVGMSPATADVFLSSVRSAFSLEPRELSMFFLLYYAATAGSYAALVDVAGDGGAAEGHRMMLGTQELIAALAAEVSAGPGKVVTNRRVTRIERTADGVTVFAGGDTYRAKHVIVAMSPPQSSSITHEPTLDLAPDRSPDPAGKMRLQLCQQMAKAQARTIKGFVYFKEPFWRAQGRMGFFLSATNDRDRPVDWALDNVWDPTEFLPASVGLDQRKNAPRCSLMTFIVGDAATYWSDPVRSAKRGEAVIDHLQAVFGFRDDQLRDPTNRASNYVEFNWVDAGIPAPGAMMPPNTLIPFGAALRTPLGRIHWAGSESGREWCGYMDGAVESGFRAAAEVIDQPTLPLPTARKVRRTNPPAAPRQLGVNPAPKAPEVPGPGALRQNQDQDP